MPTTPRVSITIPAYKQVHYLREALHSALSQTYTDFEILVGDDSNSAEIKNLCAELNDPRISYIPRPANLGISLNNKALVCEARGEYIAKLDHDDLWNPDFLEKVVPIMEANAKIGIVFCDHWLINPEGEIKERESVASPYAIARSKLPPGLVKNKKKCVLVDLAVPVAMGSIIRKSAIDIENWTAAVGGAYDRWLAVTLAASDYEFFYVKQHLTRYRLHAQMTTVTHRALLIQEVIVVYDFALLSSGWTEWTSKIKTDLANNHRHLGRYLLRKKDVQGARGHFKKSWKIKPTVRTLLLAIQAIA